MKGILSLLFLLISAFCWAEDFRVDSITFNYTYNKAGTNNESSSSHYSIPQITALTPAFAAIADSINNRISHVINYNGDNEEYAKKMKELASTMK